MVEVALAAAVALHRVEAHLAGRDALRAVAAADHAVHAALDGERARLDQLGDVVDLVERVEPVDAARIGDRDHPVELPVVARRQRDALRVRGLPHHVRRHRAAEVSVELGHRLVGCERARAHRRSLRAHFGMSVRVWGGWSEQERRPARRSGWNPFKSRPVVLRSPGAASRSERSPRVGRKSIAWAHYPRRRTRRNQIVRPGDRLQADPAAPGTTIILKCARERTRPDPSASATSVVT